MRCCFCGEHLLAHLNLTDLFSTNKVIKNKCCDRCYLEVRQDEKHQKESCQYCQKKGPFRLSVCEDCQRWQKIYPNLLLKHEFLYEYNEKIKEYFQLFKFTGDIRMSQCFSRDIYHLLNGYQKNDYLIVPIPISKERLKTRGFNQVEEFLKASDISYSNVLVKKKDTQSQSEKGKEERLVTKQPFDVSEKYRKKIKNKKVLLVDDVYTTGRTLLHAYDCVLAYKPLEIRSFSLAR